MKDTRKETIEALTDWRAQLVHIVNDLYSVADQIIVDTRDGEDEPHMVASGLAEQLDSMDEGMRQLVQKLQPETHNDTQCSKYNEPVLPDENGNCSLCGAILDHNAYVCEHTKCGKDAKKVVNAIPGDYDGEHNYYCDEHALQISGERGVTADAI